MNTFIDRQLAQIKVQEMLQEAAEARADRKARMAGAHAGVRKFRFALVTAAVAILSILWMLIAG